MKKSLGWHSVQKCLALLAVLRQLLIQLDEDRRTLNDHLSSVCNDNANGAIPQDTKRLVDMLKLLKKSSDHVQSAIDKVLDFLPVEWWATNGSGPRSGAGVRTGTSHDAILELIDSLLNSLPDPDVVEMLKEAKVEVEESQKALFKSLGPDITDYLT